MDARHIKARLSPIRALLVVALIAAPAAAGHAQDSAAGLRGQVQDLAEAQGIAVSGLDKIDPGAQRRDVSAESAEQRLQALLAGFNFVILQDSTGRISGVRVLGRSRAGPPKVAGAVVPATRRGAHYLVDAVLVGPTGLWANRRLIVDTGATTVVLPVSAIPSLGLRDSDLTLGTVETAGGKVAARMGKLAAVRVGHAEVKDVPVTFIADEHLGQKALLGMSFLDHFRLTIDDTGQRVILTAK